MELAESHSRIRSGILYTGLSAFQSHLEDSRDLAALSATRTLIDILCPLIGSSHSDLVLHELVYTLVTISDIQREIGEFPAALDALRDALPVARELMSQYSKYIYPCVNALACHAHSLVDGDAYNDATALLQEASSIMSSDDASEWAEHPGLFGTVHAHAAISGRPSCIDKAISASCTYPNDFTCPFWLSPHIWVEGGDKCTWLLLIGSVMECTTSPSKVLVSAKESLTLMSQYYKSTRARMKPYTRASVLGNQYILQSILRDHEQGQSLLNESVILFHMVFDDDPCMARLPLLVFLDILLVLFHPLLLRFETTTLQRWKKSVYEGSMGFFDNFVIFLKSLPYYTHAKS